VSEHFVCVLLTSRIDYFAADPCITRALGQAPTLAASEMNTPQGLDAASALLELAKFIGKKMRNQLVYS